MDDRLKRALIAVLFLVAVAGIGFVLYLVFFKKLLSPPATPSTPPVTTGGGTGTLPGAGSGVIIPSTPGTAPGTLPTAGTPGTGAAPSPSEVVPQTALLNDGVTQYVSASTDGRGARYYNPTDGLFYRIGPDGVAIAMSDTTFPNVEGVSWGKASDQAILSFPDGSNVHFDFRTNTQSTLPAHWEDFDFSGDDRQLVAKSLALSPGSRYLVVSNPDGSNPKAIEPLGNNAGKTFPVWTPNNQIIAYAEVGEARGFDRQEIILVGQNQENFRALQVEGRGFLPKWSPDGRTVLYSVWNAAGSYRPELWVSGGDPDGVNRDRAKLDLFTWADKCVWADNVTLYCAVPDSLPTGAGLQPDLFRTLPDTLYKIDLRTGAKSTLGKPAGGRAARNLVITDDKRHILFTDAQTGQLYDFRIP
jgi:Tol biopolymer transport system component